MIGLLPAVQATHIQGGEVTWECQGSGEFVFTLKLIRNCPGIALPTSQTLTVQDHPSVSSISLSQVNSYQLSYNCNGTPFSCANGDPVNEVIVYESAPIALPGVPPASGWVFIWNTCCRQPGLINMANPNGEDVTIYGAMYPWNGTNMYPCFDNSPTLDAPAEHIAPVGAWQSLHSNPTDVDRDSIVVELMPVLGSYTAPFNTNALPTTNYAIGYSASNPISGFHAFNSESGVIDYLPTTIGLFSYATKYSAYKDNILVSETMRDAVVMVANASDTIGPVIHPPYNNTTHRYLSC